MILLPAATVAGRGRARAVPQQVEIDRVECCQSIAGQPHFSIFLGHGLLPLISRAIACGRITMARFDPKSDAQGLW